MNSVTECQRRLRALGLDLERLNDQPGLHGTSIDRLESVNAVVHATRVGRGKMTPAEEKIAKLAERIRRQHGVEPRFFSTEEVVLQRDGQACWRRVVYIYDVIGHPNATRTYVWTYATEEGERAVAVLGCSPDRLGEVVGQRPSTRPRRWLRAFSSIASIDSCTRTT